MSNRTARGNDGLGDFARRTVAYDGTEKRVYVAGSGPAVIVMSEMRHQPRCGAIRTLGT